MFHNALESVRDIDVFDTNCPGHQLISRIGHKWTLLVIHALSRRTTRYTELQKEIGQISPKMLTHVLRNLAADELVSRKAHPVVPPMVEYMLTPLGKSLADVLAPLNARAEPQCSRHKLMGRIGNKWTLLVIYALSQGKKRYSELRKQIGFISPKMLTQVLKNLEADELIEREVYPVIPPKVEYNLTPDGLHLAEILASLCVWAEDNYEVLSRKWQ